MNCKQYYKRALIELAADKSAPSSGSGLGSALVGSGVGAIGGGLIGGLLSEPKDRKRNALIGAGIGGLGGAGIGYGVGRLGSHLAGNMQRSSMYADGPRHVIALNDGREYKEYKDGVWTITDKDSNILKSGKGVKNETLEGYPEEYKNWLKSEI